MTRSAILTPHGALEPGPMAAILANHAIPGCEVTESGAAGPTHTRLLSTPGGPRRITVTIRPHDVELSAETDDHAEFAHLVATTRAWLDLDTDTVAVARAFDDDPLLGPLVRERPGLRAVGYPEPFEAAVMTVLGQQVSVAAGGTFGGRLAAAYGTPTPSGLTLFPPPEVIASAPHEELRAAVGVTRTRAATVQNVARAVVDGLSLDPLADRGQLRKDLLAIPGIGPWSADYLTVRVLRDADAFTPGDLVARRAMGNPSIRDAERRAEPWRPFRAYALFHLWTSATYRGD
ncbi:DNA-3-methyladenine glycosylase 2 family protein [Arthrobacter agilis]|uniref:DNA-3-methyladenine glycosylase family protein n=1 Tax=Arthrobacter agilis TaxID=37921 RepID=UPI000B3557CF|nr:AlkA N-terminal domain-containing protein [Arthrobacter agilis]PPB45769.1 DNA-3-methyladenine glycosylase 2 family protein [Arthrobacter agilis]TPV26248.1 DNA-3-methyladenine glycosylase 2 family protein [Arthrobacter agilis]